MWKLAKFTTVFKNKGEIDCISNNRPISILSSIGKSMETYILNMFIASYYWKMSTEQNFNGDLDLLIQVLSNLFVF
jgi:hypothetical protein